MQFSSPNLLLKNEIFKQNEMVPGKIYLRRISSINSLILEIQYMVWKHAIGRYWPLQRYMGSHQFFLLQAMIPIPFRLFKCYNLYMHKYACIFLTHSC